MSFFPPINYESIAAKPQEKQMSKNSYIPLSDVPQRVYGATGASVTILTVYNWVKKGYKGLFLKTTPIKKPEGAKGRTVIQGVRLDSLNKFIRTRYAGTVNTVEV